MSPNRDAEATLTVEGTGTDIAKVVDEFIEKKADGTHVKVRTRREVKLGELPAIRIEGRATNGMLGLSVQMTFVAHEGLVYRLSVISLSSAASKYRGRARAFATDAEILLMDEPFSALDPLIREHLQEELLEFQRRLRKTILFVSHDLDEALKIGSRIAIMEAARIIQVGRPEEIITRPATDYVRQFVANVNPLNVMRAATLMRPLDALAREPGASDVVLLDAEGVCRCRIDGDGRPLAFLVEGAEWRALPVAAGGEQSPADALVAGMPETTMRLAIEVCHRSGRTMPILDAEGRLIGALGTAELIAGMLRRGAD